MSDAIQISENSDHELVKILCHGKKEARDQAFNEVYGRYSAMVHAYCLFVLKVPEQAEDVFQDTFIRFYVNVREQDDITNLPGFLLKIAKNLCLNVKRSRKIKIPVEGITFTTDHSKTYEKTELLELILSATELLDEKYRTPFIMREFNGMPYSEICERINVSLSNAKLRVSRAKQKLIKELQPYIKDLSK